MTAPRPSTIVFSFDGPVARADVSSICDDVRMLLEASDATVVVCDVGTAVDPDITAIEALARVQLTALRLGRRVWLRGASRELRELLAFLGLDDVLRVESCGQAEERKQRIGVEKEAELDDPAV